MLSVVLNIILDAGIYAVLYALFKPFKASTREEKDVLKMMSNIYSLSVICCTVYEIVGKVCG